VLLCNPQWLPPRRCNIKATTIQQSTMSPSKAKLPTHIAKGVRVKTKGKNPRHGTVTEAKEKHNWLVQFDDDGSTEVLTSNRLIIYKEYYNKPSQTPVQKAKATIEKLLRKTVGRQPLADKSSNDSSSFDSHQSDEEESTGHDEDEDYVPGGVQITDSPNENGSDEVEVELLTPRPLDELSPGRPNRALFDDESQASADSRNSNHSFDDVSEDEEDERFLTTALDDDGVDHCDFIDKPQKMRDYLKASKLMKEKKKELIGTKVIKTVKPTNKYSTGGLVVGAPNTIKAGEKGTIIDESDDDIFLVEWDNDALPDSRVEKKHLRLQKGVVTTYVWEFVEDHVADNPPTEYQRHGVIGFSAKGFHADVGDADYDHPFAKLVEELWPGNWRDQLSNLNKHIRTEHSSIKQVTDDEWWTFYGIMAFAAGAGVGGEEKLWDKKQKLFPELPKIDLSDRMKKYRFKQIKQLMPKAFVGNDESDPWNPIKALIDGFNNARAQNIAASYCKVHDESMSSWKTRTTKLGGLPFLSFILRKPKPLGTEFKVNADTETGKCK
jgi:hypothetical protein